ncbi:zinc transporter 3-like [Neltuma alba]|uniref:zinc transporter 3-like n=1 Tax=Neltuma alba TaxID=207710 RepID=UPI0010A34F1D|nr:zinc transporter 3-like [Prosopis alba]
MPSSQFNSRKLFLITLSIFIFLLPNLVLSQHACENNSKEDEDENKFASSSEAAKYKLIAIASTFAASTVGISLPILAKNWSYLKPESDLFFIVKAFAAGVILATGFLHVLPDAFEALENNPCIAEKKPWGNKFPFPGLIAMVAATVTLIMEALVVGYHKRCELTKARPLRDENDAEELGSHIFESSDNLRHTLVSQILELGIVVHSAIIGISLGASKSPNTIKPLVAALSFHQCFEGMGLGGCIAQAKFKCQTIVVMVLLFCLTIPMGIGIGVGISNAYNGNSQTAIIVEGVLLSASAGILIFMALVDLLATDFIFSSKMLTSLRLQLGATSALLMGLICMSILVQWGE